MPEKTTSAVRRICETLREFQYEPDIRSDGESCRIQAERGNWPIVPNFVLDHDQRNWTFYIHIRIRGQIGARTDELLVYGAILAVMFRTTSHLGVELIMIAHPAVEGELGDVLLRCSQPSKWFGIAHGGLKQLQSVIYTIALFNVSLSRILDSSPDARGDCECGLHHAAFGCEEWVESIAPIIGREPKDFDAQERVNPTWKFVTVGNLFIVKSPGIATNTRALLAPTAQSPSERTAPVVGGSFFSFAGLFNFVPRRDVQCGNRILQKLENRHDVPFLTVPLENMVVLFGGEHMLGILSDCGFERYRREQIKQAQALQRLSEVIFPSARFQWKEMPGDVLEELAYDLLASEPGVEWVRRVGSTHDRDAGRDLLAEVIADAPKNQITPQKVPLRRTTIVVQCKAYSRSVGKADVQDIRDTVEHHGAAGYLLIASPSVTSGLVDHLMQLRRRLPFVDWWTRAELEQRLLKNPAIAAKYREHVTMSVPRPGEV